jgi:O-antigen ligase
MKKFFSKIPHNWIAYLACVGVIVGLFLGKAIISISVTLFMVNAIINREALLHFRTLLNQKAYLFMALLFLVYLISGLWSNNLSYYFHKSFMHLPYLTIALGIHCFNFKEKKIFHSLFAILIVCTAIGCTQSLWQYLQNKPSIDASYNFSKVMPTPFKNDHIRFSIIVVLSSIFSVYLLLQAQSKIVRIFLILFTTYFIIYLHILAVKTGIISFYFLTFLSVAYLMMRTKKIKSAVIILTLICLMPIVAINFSNTFRAKLNYFKYSLEQINSNANNQIEISDEGRLMSYSTAWQIWKNNFILGVGAGDMDDAMHQQYDKQYGKNTITKKMLPHNQFLVMGLVAGIFGLLVLLLAVIAPLLMHYKKSFLFVCVWLLMLLPLLVEPLHETQIGLSIHVFFIILLYKYIDNTYAFSKINK